MLTGDEIRHRRQMASMTQADLAKAVGVSVRSIGNYERGETIPRNKMPLIEEALAHSSTPEIETVTWDGHELQMRPGRRILATDSRWTTPSGVQYKLSLEADVSTGSASTEEFMLTAMRAIDAAVNASSNSRTQTPATVDELADVALEAADDSVEQLKGQARRDVDADTTNP